MKVSQSRTSQQLLMKVSPGKEDQESGEVHQRQLRLEPADTRESHLHGLNDSKQTTTDGDQQPHEGTLDQRESGLWSDESKI